KLMQLFSICVCECCSFKCSVPSGVICSPDCGRCSPYRHFLFYCIHSLLMYLSLSDHKHSYFRPSLRALHSVIQLPLCVFVSVSVAAFIIFFCACACWSHLRPAVPLTLDYICHLNPS